MSNRVMSHTRERARRPRRSWLLVLLVGLAGLLSGLAVGNALLIVGGLMVTAAAMAGTQR